jgi:hypothetical protein
VLRGIDQLRSRGVKGKDFKDGVRELLRSTFGHPLKVRRPRATHGRGCAGRRPWSVRAAPRSRVLDAL